MINMQINRNSKTHLTIERDVLEYCLNKLSRVTFSKFLNKKQKLAYKLLQYLFHKCHMPNFSLFDFKFLTTMKLRRQWFILMSNTYYTLPNTITRRRTRNTLHLYMYFYYNKKENKQTNFTYSYMYSTCYSTYVYWCLNTVINF